MRWNDSMWSVLLSLLLLWLLLLLLLWLLLSRCFYNNHTHWTYSTIFMFHVVKKSMIPIIWHVFLYLWLVSLSIKNYTENTHRKIWTTTINLRLFCGFSAFSYTFDFQYIHINTFVYKINLFTRSISYSRSINIWIYICASIPISTGYFG